MKANPVSFGSMFVIRYRKGKNTTQEQLDDRMANDYRILLHEGVANRVDKIENGKQQPEARFPLSQNEIRFFTNNSYHEYLKDYLVLKTIDKRAAEQFVEKETQKFVVTV